MHNSVNREYSDYRLVKMENCLVTNKTTIIGRKSKVPIEIYGYGSSRDALRQSLPYYGLTESGTGDYLLSIPDSPSILDLDPKFNYFLLSNERNDLNIFHWLYLVLPRLIGYYALREASKKTKILILNNLSPLHNATLEPLRDSESVIQVSNFDLLRCGELFYSKIIQPYIISQQQIQFLREFFEPIFKTAQSSSHARKIYISREDANTRRVRNEGDLLEYLSSKGFEKIIMSELTFQQQLQTFKSADKVILPHGAAGAYIGFMARGSQVIELGTQKVPAHFFLLSQIVNINYTKFASVEVDPLVGDMLVDLASFIRAFDSSL